MPRGTAASASRSSRVRSASRNWKSTCSTRATRTKTSRVARRCSKTSSTATSRRRNGTGRNPRMSVIRVICPECDKTLALKASAAGKLALCPACKSKTRIPDATGEDDFEPAPAPPPRKAPVKSRVEEAPPPRKQRPVEEEEEAPPKRKPLKIDEGALRRRRAEEEEEYPEPVDEDEEDRRPKQKKKK